MVLKPMINPVAKIRKYFLFLILFLTTISAFSIENDQTYTINFNNVSITEYIKFVSKICNTNFIYEDGDLNFTVTVVSEDEIEQTNVMATLIQILRIHGLTILEENNNLVIHKNPEVKQLAKIVTDNNDLDNAPPIITRIFRIRNAKLDTIASIIRPMISTEAILELSSDTRQLIVTDILSNIKKIGDLIDVIDSPQNPLDIEIYNVKENTPEYLMELTNQIMAPIAEGAPFILVPQEISGTLFIISTPRLIEKSMSVLSSLDTAPKSGIKRQLKAGNIFVYKPLYLSKKEIENALNQIVKSLESSGYSEANLMDIISSAKWISDTHSFLFTGSDNGVEKLQELLGKIDVQSASSVEANKMGFFVYKPEHRNLSDVASAIKELSSNLKDSKIADQKLIDILESVKETETTQSLIFTGDSDSFLKVKDLLASIDLPEPQSLKSLGKSSFYIYKPQHKPLEELASSLNEISKNLESAKLVNPAFMRTIESMKVVKSSNSLLFTGDPGSIQRIEALLQKVDTPLVGSSLLQDIYIYQPKYASRDQIEDYLKNISNNIDTSTPSNVALKETIKSLKWMEESNSFLFNGTDVSTNRIKELLSKFDTQEEIAKLKDSYNLYKLENTSGNIVVEDLDTFADELKNQKIKRPNLIEILEKAKWVKETNSILLTGSASDLSDAIKIVKDFDTTRTNQEVTSHSNYFLYKPKFSSPQFVEQSLIDTAENLEKAHLADPALLNAINGVRIVDSTNSLAFTGTPDSIKKIKSLIEEIDVPGAGSKNIHKDGKTTFLVYKIQKAAPQKLINSVTTFAQDLERSGASDKNFIKTLQSVKFKPEINSLLFTGPNEALEKTQTLLGRLDSEDLSSPTEGPSAYYVYKPKYLTGKNLQEVMSNFAAHLKLTGFDNKKLFNSIQNMKWDDQTTSLLFSGDEYVINEIKSLLETFDVPSHSSEQDIIQPIDDTSFLVYKLQYHKGDSIQTALKQISKEIASSQVNAKPTLLSAINSIQWIEVTNSLLCSGDRETMSRLKELINSLDVPLKQVFIEMLVIETSFSNMLNFGLDWGSKYKHKNKFVTGISNSPYPGAGPGFSQNLDGLSNIAADQVKGSSLPFTSGFDLGIIGDIILHKGQSFLSLGSLLQAVQHDDASSVIMTPKILAQDSKPSYLFIGQNIPYIGSQTTFNQVATSQNTTTNLEYRDVGMEITITPVLGNAETVSLDINMTRSVNQDQNSSANLSGVNGITTDKTTMTTTVHIPDKSFLVLSGMGNEHKTKAKTGIPCLGGLPLIGAAFSENNRLDDKKNIVIFIRPHIINSYKDMETVTEKSEDFFRDSSGSVDLEADFDEAVDYLKTYEDEE